MKFKDGVIRVFKYTHLILPLVQHIHKYAYVYSDRDEFILRKWLIKSIKNIEYVCTRFDNELISKFLSSCIN